MQPKTIFGVAAVLRSNRRNDATKPTGGPLDEGIADTLVSSVATAFGHLRHRNREMIRRSPPFRFFGVSSRARVGACSNKRGIKRTVLEGRTLDALKDPLAQLDLVKKPIAEFHQVNRRVRALLQSNPIRVH